MNKQIFSQTGFALIAFLLCFFANAQTLIPDSNGIIYVKTEASGNGDGSSWNNATNDLHNAIHVEDVQKVFAAVGTYFVGEHSFVMKNGVEIYGGFDPDNNIDDLSDARILPSLADLNQGSVLNGQNVRPVIWNVFDDASDPLALDNTAVLDGFTVAHGRYWGNGGGIRNYYASPIFRNLLIRDNYSSQLGGGMANKSSFPTLENVVFKSNESFSRGAAMANFCGDINDLPLTNCPLQSVKLTNVLFIRNIVQGSVGGGIYTVNDCELTNVTIAENYASSIHIEGGANVTIANSIICRGYISTGTSNHTAIYGIYTAQNSFIEGNTDTSNGNINTTGFSSGNLFTNPAALDYSLKSGSPVINAGNNALNTNDTDLNGNPRINGTIDLGAYESTYATATPDNNGIVYVKPTATGNGSGNSWANATDNISGGIYLNNVQQVWAAKGTYNFGGTPHTWASQQSPSILAGITIKLKNNIAVYGGFDPDNGIDDLTDERILPNPDNNDGSILNGFTTRQIINNDFTADNPLDNTAVLDGFTLTGGKNITGGAIYNNYASPTLTNLVMKDNVANNDGGAMFNLNFSSPVITNVTIQNNTATYAGGVFNRNSSSPVMTNVVIKDNIANNDGGGMYNDVNTSPVMTNVAVTGNTAQNGAGIYNRTNSSPLLTNATIANNSGSNAIYNENSSTSFANSIVFGTVSGTYTAQYSIIEGSSSTDNGNIDMTDITTDDVFTDAANGDYTLLSTSPAVNTGNNSLNTTTTDLAGNERLSGSVIDMGAYEFTPAPLTPDANGIIYVKTNLAGNGSGNSWANATSDLHNAIHTENVQKVFVAIGNYPVGESSFVMKNDVEIYGGFDPDNGIIDLDDERILPNQGTAEGSVLNGQNARPVVWNSFTSATAIDNTAILDGFTITNGYGSNGGGLENRFASPILRNLVIKNNTATSNGGGLSIIASPLTLSEVVIKNNTAKSGGGIYIVGSSPNLINSIIQDNIANEYGGGIYNTGSSSATITNVTIKGNTSQWTGAGFFNNQYSSPVLTNVLITGNLAESPGDSNGAFNSSGYVELRNVTIAGNIPSPYGGSFSLETNGGTFGVHNSIIFGGTSGSNIIPQYSFIQGNSDTSNGNINTSGISLTDIFTDPANSDYTLKENAVVIDAGSEELYEGLDENTKDLAGNSRVYQYNGGGVLDIGAYESEYSAFPYIALTPDVNGIIYVRETAVGDENGSSWDNATANLKKAIQTTDVEQVWVATGTYQVNNIKMKNGVSVYGGFDPDNGIDDLTDSRVLPDPDANIEGSVLNGQNTGVIISNNNNGLDNTAILDGFTLTNGQNATGGAIYNNGASPTLQNLWIKENTATSDGGAMFNINSSSPVMTNITLSGNTANYAGAVFNRNSSSPVMTDVVIRNNTANSDGGAMYNDVSASPVMTNVILTGNSAQNGAGMYNRTNSSPVMTNTLIANNTAVTNGGAIRNEATSSPILTNVTIANNGGSNALYATDGTTTFNNAIVFGTVTATYTAQYSLIEGNTDFTNGNIDMTGITTADVFYDPANGDYSLKDTSLAVNAGNNALNTTETDLAGNARIYNNAIIDLGAYESSFTPSACADFTIWNGTVWSNGEPDLDTKAVIDGSLVLSADLTACELEVTTNGHLEIPSGFAFTVNGQIINNAPATDFVVESNGILLQINDVANTGAVTVKRESSPMKRLDYTLWSSPVSDMLLKNFSEVSPTGGSGTLWNRVYTLGETAWNQVWANQADFQNDTTQTFTAAQGYLYRSRNDYDAVNTVIFEGIFTGVPQNGTINIATPLDFNAIGNPYPSPVEAEDFLVQNPGILYFWTNVNASNGTEYVNNNWAYYVANVGGTGVADVANGGIQFTPADNMLLQPGQGFVLGTEAASVTFDNTMRTTDNGSFFKQMSSERHRYWLNLSNEEVTFNQMLVAYVENATQGVDVGIDAKMFAYEGNALYSLIENSSENYVIQGRELPFTDTDVVPLGFRAVNAGSFTISLNNFDGLFEDGTTQIYLKDNFSQTQHNLNSGAYTFVSEEGVFNNRFEVVYQTTMSVGNPDWQYNWIVFKQDKSFQIQTQGFEMKEVSVYDLLGRNIYTSKAEGTIHQIPALGADGVFIVKITTTEDKVLNKKVR